MEGFCLFFIVMVGLITTAHGGHYAIVPTMDSSIHSDASMQDTIMGLDPDLYDWFSYGHCVIRFYMMFDFSGVPSTEDIDGMTLLLYQTGGTGFSPRLNFHYVSDDGWDETSITWNNRPDGGAYQQPPFAVADIPVDNLGWMSMNLLTENWDRHS